MAGLAGCLRLLVRFDSYLLLLALLLGGIPSLAPGSEPETTYRVPEPRVAAAPTATASVEPAAEATGAPAALPPDGPPAPLPAPLPWEGGKDYLLPALEILGFDTLLNLFDRRHFGCCEFHTNLSTIRENLRRSWVVDSDTFTINQIGHPYQGSMYHGFARASGLSYWEAGAYTFLGSAFWEIAGERTPPSKNDQVSTGIGGSFLGEALFRMSNLWLEQGRGSPFWREVAAAAISPPVGFNRLAFGSRFKAVYSSNDAVYDSRLQLGVASAVQNQPGTSSRLQRNEAIADFALEYGLPGKRGYTYRRPFDYFTFQAAASSAIGVESVSARGLLVGTDFKLGKRYDGIWGLYGSYEYLAPQIFRLASTALSLGTTGEWRVSDSVALQGTGLLGAGYVTVSTLGGLADEKANSYGTAPQAALALRATFGDRVAVEASSRHYFVGRLAGSRDGHDDIARSDVSVTWRVHRQHAVSLRYQRSARDAVFPVLGDRTQRRGTVGVFYTLLGRDRFGSAAQ